MIISEKFFPGRDNSVDLVLTADGSPVDLSAVTRVDLVSGGNAIASSHTSPAAFDLNPGPTGGIKIFPGRIAGLSARNYSAQVVTFDAANPNGIVWGVLILV